MNTLFNYYDVLRSDAALTYAEAGEGGLVESIGEYVVPKKGEELTVVADECVNLPMISFRSRRRDIGRGSR